MTPAAVGGLRGITPLLGLAKQIHGLQPACRRGDGISGTAIAVTHKGVSAALQQGSQLANVALPRRPHQSRPAGRIKRIRRAALLQRTHDIIHPSPQDRGEEVDLDLHERSGGGSAGAQPATPDEVGRTQPDVTNRCNIIQHQVAAQTDVVTAGDARKG